MAIVIVYLELSRTRNELAQKSIYFGNTYEDGTCKWATNAAAIVYSQVEQFRI